MKARFLLLFLLMAVSINSCGTKNSNASAQPAQPETMVLIKTTAGDITIKLYDDTPLHRDNFIKLVEEHFYDSLMFHRVIREFMVQAGDPESRYAPKNVALGSGGPGYTIPAEIVYPKYFHKRGVLSAARQADPINPERKSSGSQFYIVTGKSYTKYTLQELEQQLDDQQGQGIFDILCARNRTRIMEFQNANDQDGLKQLQDSLARETKKILDERGPFRFSKAQVDAYLKDGGAPYLDGQYTVFGEVVDGMKVVDKIERAGTDQNDRPRKDIRIITMEIIN